MVFKDLTATGRTWTLEGEYPGWSSMSASGSSVSRMTARRTCPINTARLLMPSGGWPRQSSSLRTG